MVNQKFKGIVSIIISVLVFAGIQLALTADRNRQMEDSQLQRVKTVAASIAEETFSYRSPVCYVQSEQVKIVQFKSDTNEYIVDLPVTLDSNVKQVVFYLHMIDGGRKVIRTKAIENFVYSSESEKKGACRSMKGA